MKLFSWIFSKKQKQEAIQPEPSFESHEVGAKRYDDFIRYMDRQAHWRIERGE
ncbi:hypothetical protein SAMN05660328_1146 [Streptococcus gallolyticus]|uniref:Uncharacterized protein n=1 Tax=Streptococcus gallolyticus TaxID=315405 RepID=A0A1I7JIY3_9STRE|nr:hypothetical protein [Streptococcus gallolyticus]SFC86057.1 hypothetical protein SAMN02983012_0043 [Streptococcus gallolyticus]SFU85127.1 hypothetical protein SAMN05660328_1146 [Streptococcus gallolyticus]